MDKLTGILVLATLAEALVEYLVAPIVDVFRTNPPHDKIDLAALTLQYTASIVGVLLCMAYSADLLAILGLVPPWPIVGYILTGILIGRGSNFVHDFAKRWLTRPQT